MTLDPVQITMARAGLGWSQSDLAEHAGVSLPTIQRIEKRKPFNSTSMKKIAKALTDAGVSWEPYDATEFNDTGPIIRLRVKRPEDAKNWVGSHGC